MYKNKSGTACAAVHGDRRAGQSKPYEIKMRKNKLRACYMQRRRELDPAEKAVRDEKICAAVTSLASYRYCGTVLLYAPTEYEIDVRPVFDRALRDGKRVAFPRCRTEDRSMTFHFVSSWDELLPGSIGSIPEPPEDAPVYDTDDRGGEETAICVIPAILFDKDGYRIGYGKGYYDRYLPHFRGTKIGVIYSDFTIECVPRGKFDLSADVLITEKGVRAIHAK